MNKNVLITIKKELRSIFRDKKTFIMMFMIPLIIPAMLVLYGFIYEDIDEQEDEITIGLNYTPTEAEKELLKTNYINYEVYHDKKDLDKAYDNKDIEAYVMYNKEKEEYTLYIDESTTAGLGVSARLSTYYEMYNTYLTNIYLVDHEINLEEAYNHFTLEYEQLTQGDYLLQTIFSVCFTYIIMAICVATANMATGVTATERENGTLETILTFPINKTELIVGKYISSVIIGFIAALFGLILTIVSLALGKHFFEIYRITEISITIPRIIGSILVIISASAFIAGIALALTCFSKSYKEAQSSAGVLNMVGVVPLFVQMMGVEITATYYLIPICNFEQLLMDIFTSTPNFINILIAALSTIVFTAAVIIYIVKQYQSEKILFAK